MVIPIETSNSHHRFPVSKSNESGGRKIRNMTSVIKNIKGKLTPVYVLKFTRRTDKTTLSRVNEPACKIAAKIGNKKFIDYFGFRFSLINSKSAEMIKITCRIEKIAFLILMLYTSKKIPPAIKRRSCFFSFFIQTAIEMITRPIIPKITDIIKKFSFPKSKMQFEPIFLSGSLAVFKFRISIQNFWPNLLRHRWRNASKLL